MTESKVVLITGISSGFGKETAKQLANRGHVVYGTLRKVTDVEPKINVLLMDLTDTESVRLAVKNVLQREGKIDVLINNAGMHLGGPIEMTPAEDFERQMLTGFNGLVHLTQAALPAMRQQGEGMIINISSIGGLMGLPFQGFYSAAKFAIEGFSEALRMEVTPFNIRVVVINPGDFRTNNTLNRKNAVNSGPYSDQFHKTLAVIEKDEKEGWHPEILALKICKIIENRHPRQRYIIGSPDQKLAVILKRLLPTSLFRRMLGSHYGIVR
ncbi:MAG: SDR family oxidoreductase [Bacteroidales bacterium]|nr:SDR family oxidoreductase [Bacteroidales bacterium]MDZ4205072.1 SDR family oxidoreductase [Bacteroidales bacterium]